MFNFINGTALAVQQDEYKKMYLDGKVILKCQIKDLEDNIWVKLASKLAPNNLVIRQLCLIDLFNNKPQHKNKILKLMDILSYNDPGEFRIYAEGYSYFNYTMDILDLWIVRFETDFDLSGIKSIIDKIEQGFIITSYRRHNLLYPAPFGDLRDQPLNPDLQIQHANINKKISILTINHNDSGSTNYRIIAKPIGFNAHVPKDNVVVTVIDGQPDLFKFYEGYDKKYKNVFAELKDTFHYKRMFAIIIKIYEFVLD